MNILPEHMWTAMEDSSKLTSRQREIAGLVALGMSNKEIAHHLGLRNQTVRNTLVHVFRKTSVRKRTQLAVKMVLAEQTLNLVE